MAISEFEIARCKKEMEKFLSKHRPPVHVRKEIDLSYRVENQSVEIFEVRPQWDDPKKMIESPVAKITYVKTQKEWRIFWQKSDLKWHGYDPNPVASSLESALDVVTKDQYACFWG